MHKDKNKFTLEDMLSLKRAEKPSAQEWENFNAQLKSKMLKSILTKETKHSFFFSKWTFAKIGAVTMPAFCLALVFFFSPSNVEMSLQNPVELVQIPELETAYYSDSYFTTNYTGTEYSQNKIQGLASTDVVYATNDVMNVGNFSF